jgi:murein L,D-transpeptidase YcbB/YkuD
MSPIVLLWFAILPLLTSFFPAEAHAADRAGSNELTPSQLVSDQLKGYLARLGHADTASFPGRAVIDGQLQRFYRARGYRAAWTNRQAVSRLVEVIEASFDDGLNPSDYHYDEIRKFYEKPPESPELKARADLLMTDAVFTLLAHMRTGKLAPKSLDPNWNIPWYGAAANSDVMLADAVIGSKFPEMIASLRPSSPEYAVLRKGLARYRKIANQGSWGIVYGGPKITKIGEVDFRMPLIRKRLVASGELAADAPVGMKSDIPDSTKADTTAVATAKARAPQVYTPEIFEAIKTFQHRYGLTLDGVIGNETINAMNVPVEERIDQIRANLERLRWYAGNPGGRYIMVNIPSFSVMYVQDHAVRWNSRVIVGKPDLQTPIFRAEMQYLILNPHWVIPSGILVKEAIPAIRKDVKYLSKNQLTVVDNKGKPVDPAQVNWSEYQNGGLPYRLVQASGDDGSLGRIKFMMPNQFTVYMHDTPTKPLFERTRRAYSHGCVRVDRPFELAELVLQDPVKWNLKKIEEAVNTGKTRIVNLPVRVPVYFMYQTAFSDGDAVAFRVDVYNRDKSLLDALDSKKERQVVEEAAR